MKLIGGKTLSNFLNLNMTNHRFQLFIFIKHYKPRITKDLITVTRNIIIIFQILIKARIRIRLHVPHRLCKLLHIDHLFANLAALYLFLQVVDLFQIAAD